MQVDYNTYEDQYFTCSACGWEGKGVELVNGNFSEELVLGDLDCPKCGHLVAFWQSPMI